MPDTFTSDTPRGMPVDQVAAILAFHQETCHREQVSYYPSLEALAAQVRSSRCWAEGEVFVWAPTGAEFIIMKQVAPSSCELMTITASGFKDVLTGHAFETAELVAQLRSYLASSAG
jgi:hypothetical protein